MADNDIDPDIDLDPAPQDTQDNDADNVDPDVTAQADADESNDDGDGGQGEEEAPELIDWDLGDGKKVKVPAAVKDALLRQQDYTKKTQEVAEQRRAIEAEKEAFAASRKADKELQAHIGRLSYVEDQLERFVTGPKGEPISVNDIDWVTWQQRNPQEAQKALQRAQALQQQRANLQRAVDEGKQKHESETKQATAKRLADTRAFAEKEIPNWTPARDTAIAELLETQLGIPRDEVLQFISPKTYQLADLALDGFKYREARAKKSSAAKQTQQSNITPLRTVAKQRSGGQPPGLSDKLSTEEWMKRRNKQLQQKAG